MQGALVAGWVAGVADDSEDGLMGLLRVDSHEVADLHTASVGFIAAHDIVDLAGVDVAPWIALVVIGNIGEGSLRDVVAGERIFRRLQDGTLLVVHEIADDLLVGTLERMRIDKDVKGRLARRPVSVGRSIDINVHPVRQHVETRMRCGRLCVCGGCGYSER